MFHSMKVSALVAGMFVTPSFGQAPDMFETTTEPAAEVQSYEPAADVDVSADETENYPSDDYSYLPPWESSDTVDPPLPTDAASDVDEAEVATEEDPFGEVETAEAAPEPAYWVAGTDEDDEAGAGGKYDVEQRDGMDDDDAGMVPPHDEDAYVN